MVKIAKFGQSFVLSKLWNLSKIVKLWNLVEIVKLGQNVKFGWNCEIYLKLWFFLKMWNLIEIVIFILHCNFSPIFVISWFCLVLVCLDWFCMVGRSYLVNVLRGYVLNVGRGYEKERKIFQHLSFISQKEVLQTAEQDITHHHAF